MADRIRAWKTEAGQDVLYFDSGDCIKAGNLAVPLKPEVAWPRLARAGCDGSTLGNRESHPLELPFQAKLQGVKHPIWVGNLTKKSGQAPFEGSTSFPRAGIRIGVLGVMVPIVTARMATATKASAPVGKSVTRRST